MAKFTNKKVPQVGSDQLKVVAKKLKKYQPNPVTTIDPVVAELDDTYIELSNKIKELEKHNMAHEELINELQLTVKNHDEYNTERREFFYTTLDEQSNKLKALKTKFYWFVGLTVGFSVAINLYYWLS